MNLAIDIGNSFAKIAIVDNGQVVDFIKTDDLTKEYLEALLENYPDVNYAILVSVRESDQDLDNYLNQRMKQYIKFDHNVPVPIENLYRTPDTLGLDRLAAAVGANGLYPENNILIADFGTAITFDFVNAKGQFLGGNISPGAMTRFKALNYYTKKLPLRSLTDDVEFLGGDSMSAIDSGVVNGIVYEIEGYIGDLKREYPDLKIIFTGGDGNFFAKRLKNTIFVAYDLVAYGLDRILRHNRK